MKKNLVKIFSISALAFSLSAPSALAEELSQQDIEKLDANCQVISQKTINHNQAASCIAPIYNAASAQISTLQDKVYGTDIDKKSRREARGMCKAFKASAEFDLGTSPEKYLRTPQNCLSALTNAADNNDLSYDKEGAAYVISRLKLLRRLDVN